jgi:site-specific DNA-methyltransferase (adenine-specific)
MNKFERDGHVIFWGDAINILKSEIATESVDLIFADPPYNIGKRFANFHDKWPSDESYANWAHEWLDECIRILKPNGTLYVMTSTQAMPYFDIYLRNRLTILSRIVWHYDSSGVQARRHFGSMYEPILHCVKNPKDYTFNAQDIMVKAKTGAQRKLIDYRKPIPTIYNSHKVPGNVWFIPRVRYRMEEYEEHPSQKPEALLERIILASSNVGDIVLDPFAGTFTTAAVARKHKRLSISIESQEDYVKIGLRRVLNMQSYNGQQLLPPKKNYIRRNANGKRIEHKEGDLFDAGRKT